MNKYLCYISAVETAIKMENFKECKKSYTYESDMQLAKDGLYLKPTPMYTKQKFRIDKRKIEEGLCFIVEAENCNEAVLKRQTVIMTRVAADFDKYYEKVKNYLKDNQHDTIGILFKSGRQDNRVLSFYKTNTRYRTSFDIGTSSQIVPYHSYYSDRKESASVNHYIAKRRTDLMDEIAKEYNFSTRVQLEYGVFGYFNFEHPAVSLSLKTPAKLQIITASNCEEVEIKVDAKLGNNTISLDELSMDRYKEIEEKFFNELLNKNIKFITFNHYNNNLLCQINDDEKIKCYEISNKDLFIKGFIKNNKDNMIKIDIATITIYTTVDYVMENFRLNNKKLIIKKADNRDYSNNYLEISSATNTILAELKKQMGRDTFNAFKLLCEVDG